MGLRSLGLVATLTAVLLFVGAAESQPPPGGPGGKGQGGPGKKGDGGGKKGGKGGKSISEDDLASHILSFAKDNSGKVSRDQLPERMQNLVDQGDANKDGALDRDEIKALAAKMAQTNPFGGDGFGGKGKGKGKGKGGFDGDGFGGGKGKGKGDFGPDGFGGKGKGKGEFGPGDFGPGGKGDFGGGKGFKGKGDFGPDGVGGGKGFKGKGKFEDQ